ncbi:MAG: ribonuclease III [bacterium]|nr:ribonuclease III [bacterium]
MLDLSRFTPFEESVGVSFSNKGLLAQAFTHRSYINEHRMSGLEHNERLEFLGDAVLELVVTEYLFAKYPHKPEGELTSFRSALVNTSTISTVATGLGMNEYLLLSRGESKDTGRARQYILANTFESVIGALYLDQGYEAARRFIAANLFHLIDDIVEEGLYRDAKSRFQEQAQEKASITPNYETVSEEGPDHDKKFTVGVFLGGEEIARGDGKSKQEAEQVAARRGLEKKGW